MCITVDKESKNRVGFTIENALVRLNGLSDDSLFESSDTRAPVKHARASETHARQ